MDLETFLELSKTKIALRLNDAIQKSNIKIEHLSRKCKMSKRTIYNILKGKSYTIGSLMTIVYTLNIEQKEIFKEMNLN